MAVDTNINGSTICQIHLARGDESARLAIALDGMIERGSVVEPTADSWRSVDTTPDFRSSTSRGSDPAAATSRGNRYRLLAFIAGRNTDI